MATRWEDILRYPHVAAVIAPELSIETLAHIWASAGREECPLDNEHVLLSVLATEDAAKEVLALNLAGGWMSEATFTEVKKVAEKSHAHTLSLLSNMRLDWNALASLGKRNDVADFVFAPDPSWRPEDISKKDQPDWHTRILIAANNPYMDRKLVADFIRGAEPFESVPSATRRFVATAALRVDYEKQPTYPWQDMPSAYEMHFHKPTEALFSMVRRGELEEPGHQFVGLIQKHGAFSLDDREWLSTEKLKEIDGFSNWHERKDLVGRSFIHWMLAWGEKEPLDTGSDEKGMQDTYDKGSFALASMVCALRNGYGGAELLDDLKRSETWLGRAVYVSRLIDECASEQFERLGSKSSFKALKSAAKHDMAAFFRAYSCNTNSSRAHLKNIGFWDLVREAENSVSQSLRSHAESLSIWLDESEIPSAEADDPDREFYEKELLAAIKGNTKQANWAFPASLGGVLALSWLSGLSDQYWALFVALGGSIGVTLAGILRLETLHLKSELRELRQRGSRIYDSGEPEAQSNMTSEPGFPR